MNDDYYQRNVLSLSYNYLYWKLWALIILMPKNFDKVAENSTFCVEKTNLIRWPKCGFHFLSELFDSAWLDLLSFNARRARWDLFYAKTSGNPFSLALLSTDHY